MNKKKDPHNKPFSKLFCEIVPVHAQDLKWSWEW